MDTKYEIDCKSCQINCDRKKELCSYCLAQKIIRGKWKMLIIWHLKDGGIRFNELNRLIPTTPTTLSRQLKELENDGVIERISYNEVPPRVEYLLSTIGQEFRKVMDSIKSWGDFYIKQL